MQRLDHTVSLLCVFVVRLHAHAYKCSLDLLDGYPFIHASPFSLPPAMDASFGSSVSIRRLTSTVAEQRHWSHCLLYLWGLLEKTKTQSHAAYMRRVCLSACKMMNIEEEKKTVCELFIRNKTKIHWDTKRREKKKHTNSSNNNTEGNETEPTSPPYVRISFYTFFSGWVRVARAYIYIFQKKKKIYINIWCLTSICLNWTLYMCVYLHTFFRRMQWILHMRDLYTRSHKSNTWRKIYIEAEWNTQRRQQWLRPRNNNNIKQSVELASAHQRSMFIEYWQREMPIASLFLPLARRSCVRTSYGQNLMIRLFFVFLFPFCLFGILMIIFLCIVWQTIQFIVNIQSKGCCWLKITHGN